MSVPGVPIAIVLATIAQSGWSASAGTERFSYRDISRGGPPADASPVTWEGNGPSLEIAYERAARRLHRFSVSFSSAGAFSYVTPVRTIGAASGDTARRVEGRYEYRRYPFRNVLVRGLDAGIGIEGSGRRLSLTRAVAAGPQHNATVSAALACVAVARLHRWDRWAAEVTWTNAVSVLHQRDAQDADAASDARLWGGGWRTDLAASVSVRVSKRASLTGSILRAGEGTAVSHHSFAFARSRITAGMTYAK